MAYLESDTTSMVIVALLGGLVGVSVALAGVIFNILGLVAAARQGSTGRSRLILHAVGIPIFFLGWVMGMIYWFTWRKPAVADAASD